MPLTRLREEGSRRATGPVGNEADWRVRHRNQRSRSCCEHRNHDNGRDDDGGAAGCADAAFHFCSLIEQVGCGYLRGLGVACMVCVMQSGAARMPGRFRLGCRAVVTGPAVQHGGRRVPLHRGRQHHQPNQGCTEFFPHIAIIDKEWRFRFASPSGGFQVGFRRRPGPVNKITRHPLW